MHSSCSETSHFFLPNLFWYHCAMSTEHPTLPIRGRLLPNSLPSIFFGLHLEQLSASCAKIHGPSLRNREICCSHQDPGAFHFMNYGLFWVYLCQSQETKTQTGDLEILLRHRRAKLEEVIAAFLKKNYLTVIVIMVFINKTYSKTICVKDWLTK